ncbi:MAG: glyoxylate/hydroxypyruvate reductase A [Pseudomonadota bacterium]
MPLTVLFAASNDDWHKYAPALRDAFAEAAFNAELVTKAAPDTVDYIIYAPASTLRDFTPFTRTKAVLSLWAGVETIVTNETMTQPLARMVDPGMTQSMVEWVTGHVLRYHLGMDAHIVNPDRAWTWHSNPLASERSVCILGLGELGQAVARMLMSIGFRVSGWSRSPKSVDGVTCFSGADGLKPALKTGEITVLLLPDTSETENALNAETLAELPRGAFLINPGRGPLIDDSALIDALESGQVAHATLDVFRQEPLPRDHPFWEHPRVTVTPHIAAATRAVTSAAEIAKNITRAEAGEPLLNLVDRARGY